LGDGDPFDLSVDGKWAISRLPTVPNQILLLPTGTGEPRQLTHSQISHTGARWLPDGRIFAEGNEPGHPERAFVLDIKGDEKPVTPEGIRALVATADGKKLLTIDAAQSQFQFFPVDGGQPQAVPQLQITDRPIDFTPDDTGVFVARKGPNGAVEIWRVDLPSGKRTLLRTINFPGVSATANGLSATVSRDGKSFAYQYHPATSTEYLVEGIR
jgi:dipeptidyl aminopeptidase/acylaminoacyl peptidase